MSTSQQNMPSTLVRQQYNTPGMVPMNQNVTQMSIVKASDPNNNSVFVTNPQQQQPTLVGLQSQHTVTQPAQTNKPVSTGLPSLTQPQMNQFNGQQPQIYMQQQNPLQSYNIRVCLVSSVTYPAIWRCGVSYGRCGCECGGCAFLKEMIHLRKEMPRFPREMRYLLREICSHLQISGYVKN
jgi:hypothetical protein